MKEKWKEIYEYKSNSTYYLKGDKIYVSNLGRVSINKDTILEYGKGLWIDKGGNVKTIGFHRFPYNTLYRTIYALFKYDNKIELPEQYQIHHKDFNHLNNRLDNLILLSNREHAQLHAEEGYVPRYKDEIKFLFNKKDYFITKGKQFLKDRINTIKKNNIISNDLKRKQIKEERLKQLQKEREEKLKSGRYIINSLGYLQSLDTINKFRTCRIGVKESYEVRKKVSDSIKRKYIEDPTYRVRVGKKKC